MKKLFFVLSALLFSFCSVAPVKAAPSGRSARMAAHLKKHPSSYWLAHYLPDDRYKIAGGVWKYVSTDLDTYYHRPDSANMLRQPADMVIGFSSKEEAEEAGYRPDVSVFDNAPLDMSPPAETVVGVGQRLTLSDGVSSLVLPAGWKKVNTTIDKKYYGIGTNDEFRGPKGEKVIISIFKGVGGIRGDFGVGLSGKSDGTGNIPLNTIIKNMHYSPQESQISKFSVGRMNGVRLRFPSTRKAVNYSFGRGKKLWAINDYSARETAFVPILKTLSFG